jgi:ATP-dependent DNA ligase
MARSPCPTTGASPTSTGSPRRCGCASPSGSPISAFDLLHLDSHDLRPCVIEDRKALLRDVIGSAECERIVCIDQITSGGAALFVAVQQIGAEGIVLKCAGSAYRGGESRYWLKVKVSETSAFVITRFVRARQSRSPRVLVPVGLVKFGLAGKERRRRLDLLRDGPALRSGVVPMRPELVAEIKFFGR